MSSRPAPRVDPPRSRTGVALFAAALALYTLTASGTIASSDGATMYQLARSVALHHTIAIPGGNAYPGHDGRIYAKAGLGQAIVAAPFVYAGELLARMAHVAPGRREFLVRAVVAESNAIVGALCVWTLFALLSSLGATRRGALLVTTAFAVASPLWVYAKSAFLTEPLTSFCLLAGVLGVVRARRETGPRWLLLAGLAWGWALVTKSAMAAAVIPLASWAAWEMRRRVVVLVAPLAACAVLVAWYNVARFGSILATGYGAETSSAGFTTPLLVGLYGLLLSSGKSVFLYCPLLVLAIPGAAAMLRRRTPERALMLAILAVWCVNLPIYATFMSWAGDGSWGPRYLVPFLGLAFVPIGLSLRDARSTRHAVARWLTALGVFVTVGGVGVYFGAYLRESGEYPYTRDFRDPRFLQESHFNPAFSPVAGHWRMLLRNTGDHLRGDAPRIAAGSYESGARSPLTEDQTTALLQGLDFWWCYATYAGMPRAPIALACAALAVIAVVAWRIAWRTAAP